MIEPKWILHIYICIMICMHIFVCNLTKISATETSLERALPTTCKLPLPTSEPQGHSKWPLEEKVREGREWKGCMGWGVVGWGEVGWGGAGGVG